MTFRDAWVEMIRAHEVAHLEHSQARQVYDKTRDADDMCSMLRAGATASATGAELYGFVKALYLLNQPFRDEDE